MTDLTPEQFKAQFWDFKQRDNVDTNAIGYGPDKPFTPPLQADGTILQTLDKNYLLNHSGGPVMAFLGTYWTAFVANFGNGDTADNFIYNNALVAGQQLYP